MLYINEQDKKGLVFESFDTVVGTVTRCDRYGCYVTDDKTGIEVYYRGNENKGDRVRLGVKKIIPELNKIYWVLESNLEYDDYVA